MWQRFELKNRAKANLKRYYWMALVVTFLVGMLGGGTGGSMGSMASAGTQATQEQIYGSGAGAIGSAGPENLALMSAVLAVLAVGMLVVLAIGTVFLVFVGNPVSVGGKRYFMESRAVMRSAGVGKIFYAFGCGSYLNVVKTMFMKDLFVFLWTLLLIVPGVIKAYQYYMVPYILSENPDMNYKEALQMSKDMMDGNKWALFVLELSFFGWYLLGALLCGIGVLFVNPYVEATYAELYAVLRKNPGGLGLRGFGGEEAGYYDQVVSEQ